ncbi:antileukoproteinase-like [Tubulanus polymorphus]|uniref:antileukoproteinase-like n=1 Tax=Tubulanus polymorphus TaxID=672921 RepID=UPI003DA646DE
MRTSLFVLVLAVSLCLVVSERAGTCPRLLKIAKCVKPPTPKCQEDTDCAEPQKCCQNICGIKGICKNPVSERAGTCPRLLMIAKCVKPPTPECQEDTDCAEPQKCCQNICGIKGVCKNPAEKPGVCARRPIAKCVTIPEPQCTNDFECQKKQKCCNNVCGRKGICEEPVM